LSLGLNDFVRIKIGHKNSNNNKLLKTYKIEYNTSMAIEILPFQGSSLSLLIIALIAIAVLAIFRLLIPLIIAGIIIIVLLILVFGGIPIPTGS
jgi:hypothetical protein